MATQMRRQRNVDAQSLLLFSLQASLLAVDARVVREIRWLMEITPLAEAPPYLTGVINLRGKILPVIDLNRRFGHERQRYHRTDSIIVADTGAAQLGIIVDEVHDVMAVSAENIDPSPLCLLDHHIPPRFVTKVARVDDRVIMIVNHENLLNDSEFQREPANGDHTLRDATVDRYFCPEAGAEDRAIFRERAEIAQQLSSDDGLASMTPVAVVGLNEEYIGVELDLVREFADIYGLTPIPCSPSHIVGNMNLRGNILTLVDMPGSVGYARRGTGSAGKVIVAAMGDLSAGVVVDNVFDIAFLKPSDLWPVPSAVQKAGERYIKGTAPYRGKVMTILNLANILASEDLSVAEEV